ncbi:hypothetical protein ACFSUK_13510 [Sphingobium scionense]|uniref:Uncharacterized protein n=1 Tax=Sphingobium scionense TaxID=1404341 RepID=A0A7W6LWI8_9SPHN|nr:hypothetical protein [Sphingobium scionense]MBB4151788.1 hypothetical protein [Sphingobium scionense]
MIVAVPDAAGIAVAALSVHLRHSGFGKTLCLAAIFDFDPFDRLEIEWRNGDVFPTLFDEHPIVRRAFEIGYTNVMGAFVLPSGVDRTACGQAQGQGGQ